eukprot:TRINITY_DN3308_c0_g1_i11.p1 TRINITY_DN3308_c0_g1~~TRINITY_DN3308_c0_g1_i11.p1  ORF type:complete len:273 (+),score=33.72 TRINITY_DN3308_c0_g1_i11:540-1358(+)
MSFLHRCLRLQDVSLIADVSADLSLLRCRTKKLNEVEDPSQDKSPSSRSRKMREEQIEDETLVKKPKASELLRKRRRPAQVQDKQSQETQPKMLVLLKQSSLGEEEDFQKPLRKLKRLSETSESPSRESTSQPVGRGGKCHLCAVNLSCKRFAKCSVTTCKEAYCLTCIRKHFDKKFSMTLYKPDLWVCFACGDSCCCLSCKEIRGESDIPSEKVKRTSAGKTSARDQRKSAAGNWNMETPKSITSNRSEQNSSKLDTDEDGEALVLLDDEA